LTSIQNFIDKGGTMEKYEVVFSDNSGEYFEAKSFTAARQKATKIAKRYFLIMYPTETFYLLSTRTGEVWNKKGRYGTWKQDYGKHPVGLWQFA